MMMRQCVLTIILVFFCTVAGAIPAKQGVWKTLTLDDGTTVSAMLCGDEYVHFWQDNDGQRYLKVSASDTYRRAADSEILSLAAEQRAVLHANDASSTTAATPFTGRRKIAGGTNSTFEGEKKGLIILVNFNDTQFASDNDKDYYQRLANEENFTDSYGNTHSVRDYYLAQSGNKFAISFDIAGPVDLIYGHSYYATHYAAMVQEACAGAANQGIDFTQYDWDNDGIVEQVFILYAGHGANDTGDESYVWPHKSAITATTYGGAKVSVYACSCELTNSNKGYGIGVICHEFTHCMGLPDFYDTQYTGFYGMGSWSVLDQGSYNGNSYGYLPAAYTSYERACCNWLTPTELTEECDIENMKGLTDGGEAYIIYNKGYTDEFYLLENRSGSGFDEALAGQGLLITHVDYSSYYWMWNCLNSNAYGNDHERYTIIPADNSKSSRNESGDTWPASGKTRFDNYTTPAGETYNYNNDGTLYMNISLSSIKKNSDGTISFHFYPDGKTPSNSEAPEGAVFYESFDDCDGTGGNDNDFGSSGVGTGTFYPDNDGWTCATAHGADACAFFGSNRQAANVQTPTFAIDGVYTLSFRAAPYTALISGTLTITCETSGIKLYTTEISLPQGTWTDFNIIMEGTGDVQLRIKETSGINRFFLDEVAAVPGIPEGIEAVAANTASAAHGIYTLQGVAVQGPLSALRQGVYIVDGKKYVVR